MKYEVRKLIKATWKDVEAKSVSDAATKTRKMVPTKQIVVESSIHRVNGGESIEVSLDT